MREAPNSVYPSCIFRESFRDLTSIKGDITGTYSIENGVLTYTGFSLDYNIGCTSIKLTKITDDFLIGSGDIISFEVDGENGTLTKTDGTSTIYVNGVESASYEDGDTIIIAGVSDNMGTTTLESTSGSLDMLELFDKQLTPSEVYNLYHNLWNTEQSFGGEPKSNDIARNLIVSTGSPTIVSNNEVILPNNGINNVVLNLGYWIIGKKYLINCTVSNYSGTNTIFLPYDGSNVGKAIFTDGNYIYEYTPKSTNMFIYGRNTNGATIYVNSIQELNPKTLIDFNSTNGILNLGDLTDQSTITNVVTKKVGNGYGALFNGSDSKIDTGADMIGTKAVTVMGWIKPYSFGESNGVIVINNKFLFWITDNDDRLMLSSNLGANYSYSRDDSISLNKWQFVCATRESDGTTNFYIGDKSTAPALSGSANQNSGTPMVGTSNVIIGNNDGQTRTFDGLIPQLKVVEGILSLNEICNFWSSTLKEIK